MSVTGNEARLRDHICRKPHWEPARPLGVAVSGGSDSMALLLLLADCARERGVALHAATVDHGLRPEAAEEAAFVAETCARHGVAHQVLRWQGWDGRGNLQAEARAARYRLLADWGRGHPGMRLIAVGHTLDDQAETFLMRLGRASGVDGLAAMGEVIAAPGGIDGPPRLALGAPDFWRPLLGIRRAELRAFLTDRGQVWRDDPSNEDPRFDRVRIRRALPLLEELGIDAPTLATVAENLRDAREALTFSAGLYAREMVRVDRGDVILEERFGTLPVEYRRRLLRAAVTWVSGAGYGPRREPLDALLQGGPGTTTLHGCQVTIATGRALRITREYNAVKDATAEPGALWDNRWQLAPPAGETGQGMTIRALGEAVKDCPDWRATGLPRAALMASPAVWDGDGLVAAPLAGLENGWRAELRPPQGDFFSSILSH